MPYSKEDLDSTSLWDLIVQAKEKNTHIFIHIDNNGNTFLGGNEDEEECNFYVAHEEG